MRCPDLLPTILLTTPGPETGHAHTLTNALFTTSELLAANGEERALSPTASPAADLQQQVRHEFEVARGQADPYAIKYALSDGRSRLKQLRDMLALSE